MTLKGGERIESGAVVLNADCAALAAGLFGKAAAAAGARGRSQIAVAVGDNLGDARQQRAAFRCCGTTCSSQATLPPSSQISSPGAARLPRRPSTFCAQDRGDSPPEGAAPERLLCLMNAPADGDTAPLSPGDIETCTAATFRLLDRCGLRLDQTTAATVVTTPRDFDVLFPATGGALYGQGGARGDGDVPPPGQPDQPAGPLPGGRLDASGRGSADGGALGLPGSGECARGTSLRPPGPAPWATNGGMSTR